MNHSLETDYLVVGSGAVGMAFADILLSESDADIVIVDRHDKPGGHWNDAYPFVRLHQPSAFYGVSSAELSKGRRDQVGLNKGLAELASGAEVSAYFDDVMQNRFLPSGRVRYFPLCDYEGDGKFVNVMSGETFEVKARRKIVDCTWLKTSVPSTHTPQFSIGEGVNLIPPNGLPHLTQAPEGYTVIGAGKTGIDTCIWLLERGVDPDRIRWISPRDGWLIDRRNTQTEEEFFEDSIGNVSRQMKAISEAEDVEDLFIRLEKYGVLLRIDTDVWPQMFHGATISRMELEEMRRIKDVVRMGRVTALEQNRIVLEKGEVLVDRGEVFIDCTASAIPNLEIKPVFTGDVITPQTVRSYQPVFSAAFIAHVELAYEDEATKNDLCHVVPLPNHSTDWLPMTMAFMRNQMRWSQDQELRRWVRENRLDGFSKLVASARGDDAKSAIINEMRGYMMGAAQNLQTLLGSMNT
ncbi:MAG: NAD(P)-binding protein [Pseudomonadota bacterium]